MRAIEFILDLAGAALLGYGAWLAWEPLGFVVGGCLMLWASINLGRARALAARPSS